MDPGDAQAQSEQETEYAIVINGELAVVPHKQVSYEEAVAIAYPVPPSPETRYTVTYRKAEKPHEGSLAPGQTVEVKKDGTIFNVKATGKS
jgi:hypothetical protein